MEGLDVCHYLMSIILHVGVVHAVVSLTYTCTNPKIIKVTLTVINKSWYRPAI